MDEYVILIISDTRTIQLYFFRIKKYVLGTETFATSILMVASFNILLNLATV